MYINHKKEILKNWKGLSAKEVEIYTKEGKINCSTNSKRRSIAHILRDNIVTPFNILNLLLFLLVLLAGSPINGLFAGVAVINATIATIKEITAKKKLDKIKLLHQSTCVVIRDGEFLKIRPEDVVLNDLLYFSAGEQIIIDGIVLYGVAYVNESLISGESSLINKTNKKEVSSGSYVVSGEILVKATRVGDQTYVNEISSQAKNYTYSTSELMYSINKIIKYISVGILPLGVLLIYRSLTEDNCCWQEAILNSVAAIVGMIPEGLVLLTVLALISGNIKLTRHKALAQDIYSIENIARLDVLCFDKTGTLTDGKLKFEGDYINKLYSQEEVKKALLNLQFYLPSANATQAAIKEAYGELEDKDKWSPKVIVPFISERKWSGITYKEKGTWILGAPDVIFKPMPENIKKILLEQSYKGNRSLVLCYSSEKLKNEKVPLNKDFVCLIFLSDILKKDTKKVLRYLYNNNIIVKILSGDSALTVKSIAMKLGFPKDTKIIDGYDIKNSNDNTMDRLVCENDIFGRVTPNQKKEVIAHLKEQGRYVGMIGDGVNDVLALKEANSSLAMAKGSDIARDISQIILLDSDFTCIPLIIEEGKRIITNIQYVASLYLVKTIYSVLLTIFFILIQKSYLFKPIHLTIISTLMTGIPTFFMAFAETEYTDVKGKFLNNILVRAFPGAIAITTTISVFYLLIVPFYNLKSTDIYTINFAFLGFMHFIILIDIICSNNKAKIDNRILLLSFIMLAMFVHILNNKRMYSILSITNFTKMRILFFIILLLVIGTLILLLVKKIIRNFNRIKKIK